MWQHLLFFLIWLPVLHSLRVHARPVFALHEKLWGPASGGPEYSKAYDLSRELCEVWDALNTLKQEPDDRNAFEDASVALQKNPFLMCDVGWSELQLLANWRQQIMNYDVEQAYDEEDDAKARPPVLDPIGKLKKGGAFWKTPFPGKGFLVKSVKSEELGVLASMVSEGYVAREYADCEGFRGTLLQPVLFSFLDANARVNYIVMRDETARLEGVVGGNWEVAKKWDIKPLPSLSDDLTQVIQTLALRHGASGIMSTWTGWATVRQLLQTSVNVLNSASVVDYSMFIHVLQPLLSQQSESEANVALSPENGCITEPDGEMIICFKIIDFMTPLTYLRGLESYGKGDKFIDYSNKFMTAFDCVGDLLGEKCHDYAAYAKIDLSREEGSSDTPTTAFVRSSLFATSYECKIEYPQMYWMQVGGNGNVLKAHSPSVTATPMVEMKSFTTSYDTKIAEWLQRDASKMQAAADTYGNRLRETHAEWSNVAMKEAGAKYPLKEKELGQCEIGIRKFATQSLFFNGAHNIDLQNVLWSPQTESVFVVRNKPTLSSNEGAVMSLRSENCFLETRLYRCRPSRGWTVQTNYTTKFGALEILQVAATQYSKEDYRAWSNYYYYDTG